MSSATTLTRQVVREFLLADDVLRARVDDVVAGHVRDADTPTFLRERPVVIVEATGGFARYHAALQDVTLEIYTYSKASSDEALDVYDQVFYLLQEACVHVEGLEMSGITREMERPIDGWNERAGAWFARGRWTFKAIS